jgi:hypothetical protein
VWEVGWLALGSRVRQKRRGGEVSDREGEGDWLESVAGGEERGWEGGEGEGERVCCRELTFELVCSGAILRVSARGRRAIKRLSSTLTNGSR